VSIPSVPAGFLVPDPKTLRGHYASQAEVIAAPLAAKDLESFANYTATFGPYAPSATALVNAITVSLGWRALRTASEAFAAYAKAEDAVAWKATIGQLDQLKALFLLAVQKNPALATECPGLAQLFNAAKVEAKAALATKKRNAKAAAAEAKKATAEAAAATPATAEAPQAKTITVSA
jgi:hypothetical protein